MEKKSFQELMAEMGVSPLADDDAQRDGERSEEPSGSAPEDRPSEPSDRDLFLQAVAELSLPKDDSSEPGTKAGKLKKLKRWKGNIDEPDVVLDLHGHTRKEAIDRLRRVIKNAFLSGEKWVWIITGKGFHSPNERGVLTPVVEHWLQQHGRRFVQGYGQAPRAKGGRGVWIVHLRSD